MNAHCCGKNELESENITGIVQVQKKPHQKYWGMIMHVLMHYKGVSSCGQQGILDVMDRKPYNEIQQIQSVRWY